MNSEIIPEFYIEKSNFTFHPTHVFSNNGNRILINSKLGTIFVCDDHILNQIKSKRLSDDIQFKLIQRRSEEHTSELQSHSFISYAVFCLKKKI